MIKVEGCEQGVNTRFVVTDLEQARTKVLYQQIYCARGQADNASKDHKLSLKSDRTSCHRKPRWAARMQCARWQQGDRLVPSQDSLTGLF